MTDMAAHPKPPLNLTYGSVLRHFYHVLRDREMMAFLMSLDGRDDWAFDFEEDHHNNELKLLLSQIAETFSEHAERIDLAASETYAILASMVTSRSIFLIQYLSKSNPNFLTQLADDIEQSMVGGENQSLAIEKNKVNLKTLTRRLNAYASASLLSEIFSPKRLDYINKIMRAKL